MRTRLDTRGLDRLIAEVPRRARDLVDRTGRALLDGTQERAPVETGRLRNSYTWRMVDELSGELTTDVDYGPHQEYGTIYQSGTPHVGPAAAAVQPDFQQGLHDLLRL